MYAPVLLDSLNDKYLVERGIFFIGQEIMFFMI